MARDGKRLALFIDGANAHATTKALGFDIDYKRLLTEFQSGGTLVRAFYYTATFEDKEYSSIRPLIDWLNIMALPWSRNQQESSTMVRDAASSSAASASNSLSTPWRSQTRSITLCCFRAMGILLATRSRAAPRCPRHCHIQLAEQTTDDRRRIATPSGYFVELTIKGSHWSNVEHCSAAGSVRLVALRTRKARRARAAGPEVR